MVGDVEVSSLKGAMNVRGILSHHLSYSDTTLQLWLDNQTGMEETLSSSVAKISSAISGLYNSFLGQTRSQARLNVIASYDQSNELFKVKLSRAVSNTLLRPHIFLQAFLSKEMMYSCALWSEAEGGVRGDLEHGPTPGDLEAAQLRKIHHVLRKARVKPGHRILEFGSGWGGLAIEVSLFLTSLSQI